MRKKGTFFIVVGVLMMSAAIALTLSNLNEDIEAEKNSSYALERIVDEMGDYVAPEQSEYENLTEMPVLIDEGREYIAVISIPSLDVELPVQSEIDLNKLKYSPCRYTGCAYTSDLVIGAHNYINHFGRLKNLSVGDEVVLVDMLGNVFRYEVFEIEQLYPEEITEMTTRTNWDLTLFTCTPGGRTRVTVRCVRTAID